MGFSTEASLPPLPVVSSKRPSGQLSDAVLDVSQVYLFVVGARDFDLRHILIFSSARYKTTSDPGCC